MVAALWAKKRNNTMFSNTPYILPQSKVSLDEAMQGAIALKERAREKDEATDLRRQQLQAAQDKQQKSDWLENQKLLDTYTTQYKPSENFDQDINNVGEKHVANALQLLSNPAKQLSQPEFYSYLEQFKQGAKQVDDMRADYQLAKGQFGEWKQQHPNVNQNDAQAHFEDIFKNSRLKDDGTGHLAVNPNGHLPDLQTEMENRLGTMQVDKQPLYDVVGKDALKPAESRSVTTGTTGKGGRMKSEKVTVTDTPYSGTPYKKPDGSYGIDLAYNDVHGVKVAKPELIQSVMSNPKARVAALAGWQQQKQRLEASGITVDRRNEDDLFGAYLLKELNPQAKHIVSSAEKQTQNITNINVRGGNGSGSGDDARMRNLYAAIANNTSREKVPMGTASAFGVTSSNLEKMPTDAISLVVEKANQLYPKKEVNPNDNSKTQDGKWTPKELYTAWDDNGNLVIKPISPTREETGDDKKKQVKDLNDDFSIPLDFTSVNTKANQPYGTKSKKAVLQNAPRGTGGARTQKTTTTHSGFTPHTM